ncbi:class I SAM-dependent methyltransferase [Rhodococcus opacus]|uniref:Class I SAM-dependent methyltransferase n=1 Tax=Rhodococcus opacus TaxID=37919 RepID=A0AAX3YEG6_RHOOP|nr:class I SAM-dependent methyltransferase [Rhodococcus opacus]MCZ4584039.1 class I SAM-dependent methyltransferase [Rhodococcus opacus]MDV6245580.1 TylF/MycF/NovP-related O-methyltransferase [Rhodococcus opacus]MDX5968614.1 TylF/MycF/NovP-related O-methyltransferase [Rhodococcus opacus]NKY70717.1 class I SAM-dependent methyltransferase [Rhodococcus opacus]UNM98147.1 class I SAM-dependent methyltransferase [Rhodococcus opacus]
MFDLRRKARLKLQRAMSEVVAESDRRSRELTENQHDQTLAELSATNQELARVLSELSDARMEISDVQQRLGELEQQARRDITQALDVRATNEAAAFVLEHMPKAPVFWNPQDTLRYGLSQVEVEGLALEFGVASGTTLRIIVEQLKDAEHEVFGFDVFSGLPQTWRTGFPAGEFAQQKLPHVRGAQLVPGLFEDTLAGFLEEHPGPVSFVHLDADLYSSTKSVLDRLERRLVAGTVIVFDEFFNFPGWQEHEYRAWTEFVDRTGVGFEYLSYTANHEQVVVRITAPASPPA